MGLPGPLAREREEIRYFRKSSSVGRLMTRAEALSVACVATWAWAKFVATVARSAPLSAFSCSLRLSCALDQEFPNDFLAHPLPSCVTGCSPHASRPAVSHTHSSWLSLAEEPSPPPCTPGTRKSRAPALASPTPIGRFLNFPQSSRGFSSRDSYKVSRRRTASGTDSM